MKPLIVLLAVFCISVLGLKLIEHDYNFVLAARIAMCAMLFFTAIGHFAFTAGMAMMIPDFIPYKNRMVYLTGIFEIMLGIGLLIPAFTNYAGWMLIIFFIAILPSNIKAAIDKVDYQKGTTTGPGLSYLWFRVPLQIVFIAWTYFAMGW